MPGVSHLTLILVAVLLLGARLYGTHRWNSETEELRARLEAAREPVRPRTVDFGGLKGLPAPVGRYFRTVIRDGQPMVASVRLRHEGTFNMGEGAEDSWKPLTSDQVVVVQRPGFDWNGRVAMVLGLPVRVHDSYAAGEGVLHASVLGLFSVADMRGSGEVAEGELMRFFAEAAWYPTALLPSQGVLWEAAGDRSAYATLTEGDQCSSRSTSVGSSTRCAPRSAVVRWAAGSSRRPGKVASGTTESTAACWYRSTARWLGSYAEKRSPTGAAT